MLKILGFFLSFLLLVSCASQQVVIYKEIYVPEEAGIKLVQYTEDSENVNAPIVRKLYNNKTSSEYLIWNASQQIALSTDGKLAYIGSKNKYHNLYIKSVLGGRALTQRTFNRNINAMCFSPDNRYIAFSETKNNNSNIFKIRSEGGVAVEQLVSTQANEYSPQFSIDGRTIIYSKSDGYNYSIWSYDTETSLNTQYTEGFTPSVSPDGETIFVTRNSKDGNNRGEIWMVNLRTGSETILVSDPEIGFSSPQVSPDGRNLVFVGTTGGTDTKPINLDIFMIRTDGTKMKQLTFHGGNDLSPIWYNNGKHIFFLSQRGSEDGKYNVWKMDVIL
ncbi:MAG: hypothetical protein CR982_02515 [Candidatus Cloacimonadota bacterium]|nr:MAG: hypothetical protein CR982_02515 [Candidatus Cloacimonadota bacterium]PIE78524.1 MAG: hypothetical protein CSA15_07465 [Candidatus Delongbacteria bacterium]